MGCGASVSEDSEGQQWLGVFIPKVYLLLADRQNFMGVLKADRLKNLLIRPIFKTIRCIEQLWCQPAFELTSQPAVKKETT